MSMTQAERGRVVVGLAEGPSSRAEWTLLGLCRTVELGCLVTIRRAPASYTASVYGCLGEFRGSGETAGEALEVALEQWRERWEVTQSDPQAMTASNWDEPGVEDL